MNTTYPIHPRLAMASVLGTLTLFAGACQPEMPPGPTSPATSQPSSIEVYRLNDWTFAIDHTLDTDTTTAAQYGHRLIKDAANEVGYLLSAKGDNAFNTASACYWKATVPDYVIDRIRPGSTLRLKAAVQLSNIQGEGACLVLAGNTEAERINSKKDVDIPRLFATTQSIAPMQGTTDFVEYVIAARYTAYTPNVTIYLKLLPGTTGTAVFRDVTLDIK